MQDSLMQTQQSIFEPVTRIEIEAIKGTDKFEVGVVWCDGTTTW